MLSSTRSAPDLADPDLPRLMLRLGLPAMAGLSLNAAHQVVDAGFVGHLGPAPLAVLALLAPFAGLVAALGIGLGIGAASSVARALGEGRDNCARQIAGVCFLAAFTLSPILWITLVSGRETILNLLGTPFEILPLAEAYFPIQMLTVVLAVIQILCDFLAIGRGEVQMSLRTLALCFGLNMALDPLFIFDFGFDLGLNGAAWATLTAQIVTLTVWAIWFMHPLRRPAKGPLPMLWPVLHVGLPETAAVIVTTLGSIAVLRTASLLGGIEAVAALGIALRLMLLVILPLEGFAIGVQPVLAHAHGAQDAARLVVAQALLVKLALGIGAACAVILWAGAASLAAMLSDTAPVRTDATQALRWLALAIPAIALRLVAQISLQAAIRPVWAAVLGLAPMGWLLWPTLIVLVPRLGVSALPIAIIVTACLSALLAAALLPQGRILSRPIGVPQ